MNEPTAKVLVIDDDSCVATSLQEYLESEGLESEAIFDAEGGLDRAQSCDFDVVVTDLQMPGPIDLGKSQGLRLVRELHRAKPQLPVILMTAHHSTDTAIEATKVGAFDYVLKPIHPPDLLHLVRAAARNKQTACDPVDLGEPAQGKDALIGKSQAMQEVYKEIGRVAATNVTVLIRGETGTGKELVARALFQHSHRSDQPFVAINCAALPETLLESELFGHEAGAFTDAKLRRIGRFEQAHGGTIFLDEIGDMSLSTQVKLLRVLQEKTIQRLGGKETIAVDARILAATHRDLKAGMQAGTFRPDLYFRLNDGVIQLPPLRDRKEDIRQLALYFLDRCRVELGVGRPALEPAAISYLEQAAWPGNVRELRSVLSKVVLAARGQVVSEAEIREAAGAIRRQPGASTVSEPPPAASEAELGGSFAGRISELLSKAKNGECLNVEAKLTLEMERELYGRAIRIAYGNQSQAARWLGVSRPTLRQKLRVYDLQTGMAGAGRRDASQTAPQILIVEHDASFAALLKELLVEQGYLTQVATDAELALQWACMGTFDAVLTARNLRWGASGLELIGQIQTVQPLLPVILMTGSHTTDIAIEAIQRGAYDYFAKPDLSASTGATTNASWIEALADMLDRATASKRVLDKIGLPETLSDLDGKINDRILGKSRAMQEVYKEIGRVAATNVTVLIRGETGTGKELVARALHQHSNRNHQPFVAINCAALPETLLESELFGHEAGAFTDAKLRRIGRFEQAQGGTILLDEIGDMSPSTQVKLLRVLQEKTIQRLGGKETIAVDVRILAATHRDLNSGMEAGTFRPDLYFRLNDAVISLPPLRDRKEDLMDLASYFVQADGHELGWPNSTLTRDAIDLLQAQPWPGNIRELRNVVRRALLRARGYPVTSDEIRGALTAVNGPGAELPPSRIIESILGKAKRRQLPCGASTALKESLERELYRQAISLAEGDQTRAASWLGVSRPTIREKLGKYGIPTSG